MIDNNKISKFAISVIRDLQNNNFQAYLVGGCVRDALSGIEPKDFDIATDATPEQVRKIFKASRIIGKRFKLVHAVSYTHLRAHETKANLVCRLLLETKKKK